MTAVKQLAILATILSIAICSKAFATDTINFDPQSNVPAGDLPSGLDAMSNSPGSTVPTDAQLSNQYESDGVLFSSTAPYVAVVDIGSSAASPPNAIGGATSANQLSYADPVTFSFVVPGTTTPGVTNSISITADADGINGQFATLSAFDIDGNLINQEPLNDVGGETWTIKLPGIHSATFNFPTTSAGVPTTGSPFGEGTGIALDNLTFGDVVAAGGSPVTAVPLPNALWSSLALITTLVSAQSLRRKTSTTTL
jgi:hypothetical protein